MRKILQTHLLVQIAAPGRTTWSFADREGNVENNSDYDGEISWYVGSTMFQTQLKKPHQDPEKHVNVPRSNGRARVAWVSLWGPPLQGLS